MSALMEAEEWLQVAWSSDAKSPKWVSGWRFKPTSAAMKQQLLQQPPQLVKHGK